MKTKRENIRYEALKSIGKDGNLVVVPEGSQPVVGTK